MKRIAINEMKKLLLVAVLLALVGCASQISKGTCHSYNELKAKRDECSLVNKLSELYYCHSAAEAWGALQKNVMCFSSSYRYQVSPQMYEEAHNFRKMGDVAAMWERGEINKFQREVLLQGIEK